MSAVERFMSRVNTAGSCWLWTGTKSVRGYGKLIVDGKQVQAHRYSYALVNGPITPDQIVCHACDTPLCVRPSHLFLGDHADNVRDMLAKGRHGNQIKTHCKHGHEFTAENTYYEPPKGARRCRTCRQAIEQKRRAS